MKRGYSAVFFALATLSLCAGRTAAQDADSLSLVAVADAVLREAPWSGAREVAGVSLGTRVRVLARTEAGSREADGSEPASWLYVAVVESGPRGWLRGAGTVALAPSHPEAGYAAMMERYREQARDGGVPFELAVALERVLEEAQAVYGRSARFELLEMDAIDMAGQWPIGWPPRDPTHLAWYEEHEGMIRGRPIGGFQVSPDALWALVDRYRDTPAADTIAFRAAWAQLAHCEDDAGCWLVTALEPAGRYLARFPDGVHVEATLERMRDRTEVAAEYACWNEQTGEPRVDAEAIARTRSLLEPFAAPVRDSVLADLARIEEKCRRR